MGVGFEVRERAGDLVAEAAWEKRGFRRVVIAWTLGRGGLVEKRGESRGGWETHP